MSVLSFYTFVPQWSRLVCLAVCEVLSVLMPSFANCPPPSADGLLGACGTIEGKSVNLGYVQSSPQVASDGSISIVYLNGDRCDKGHHSTRIIFQCDDNPVSTLALYGNALPCYGRRVARIRMKCYLLMLMIPFTIYVPS